MRFVGPEGFVACQESSFTGLNGCDAAEAGVREWRLTICRLYDLTWASACVTLCKCDLPVYPAEVGKNAYDRLRRRVH